MTLAVYDVSMKWSRRELVCVCRCGCGDDDNDSNNLISYEKNEGKNGVLYENGNKDMTIVNLMTITSVAETTTMSIVVDLMMTVVVEVMMITTTTVVKWWQWQFYDNNSNGDDDWFIDLLKPYQY